MNLFKLFSGLLTTPILVFCLSGKSLAQVHADTTAGWADQNPAYTYEAASSCQDIVNGTKFWYRQSDTLFASFSTLDGSNNGKHSQHKGAVMDLIHKGVQNENLDWTQFLLSTSMHGNWNEPAQNPQLDSMWVNTTLDTIYAMGKVAAYPNIKWLVYYTFLSETLPILKIDINLINNGSTAFNGFLEYQMDPDGTYQESWVEGIGVNPGSVFTGWTSNYIYAGPTGTTFSNKPSHGIAWLADEPAGLVGLSYLFGAWFNASVGAGDSTTITFYHITNGSTNGTFATPYECIGMYADSLHLYDTSYVNSGRMVTGYVEDVHGNPVANATVKMRNIASALVAQVLTDASGNYSAFIPKDIYTFTVTALGYLPQSRSIDANIDSVLNFNITDGFALVNVDVWAGTGKTIPASSLTISTDKDIILENNKIAVALSVVTNRSQIQYASKGNPLDMIVKDTPVDLIDWIELNKLSFNDDTTEAWWSQQHVMNDTVYVTSVTPTVASVVAKGRYFRILGSSSPASNEVVETHFATQLAFRTDIDIITTYNIEPDDYYFTVQTEIKNNSGATLDLYAGDILDYDGAGQTSFVPGIGDVTGDWGFSKDFTFPYTAPWFAMYGSDLPVLGIIYQDEYADSAFAYGVTRWMSCKDKIAIAPASSYLWTRKVAIKSSLGYLKKPDVIGDIYNDIKKKETGLSYELIYSNTVYAVGDTVHLTVRFINSRPVIIDSTKLDIIPISNLSLISPNMPMWVNGLPANDTVDIEIKFLAVSGGRGLNTVMVADSAGNAYESVFPASVLGIGWYAGDNHTHSIYSDGVGTIAENVTAGYNAGLSFMTATDHNTLKQKPDVIAENAKYADMIIMTGEEVTTSNGHALAYNTGVLIPWQLSTYTHQQMIDSVNNSFTSNGKGFMYLAHPHYPGLPWTNYTVTGHTGLEVWNGFYHATHSVNTQTFADWDSLNNLGYRYLGISNSDAHNPAIVAKNYIMAYLREFTEKEIIEVMRDKGCYYGTNGPRIDFTIEGEMMGSNVKVPAQGRAVEVDVKALSNSIQEIDYVRLVKNGKELFKWTPLSTTSLQNSYNFKPVPGDFLRMEVKAGTGFAYSNPIWFELGSNNAEIIDLIINDTVFAPFDTAIHSYLYPTPVKNTPTLEVIHSDTNATVVIDLPVDVTSSDVADRTATITITAADKFTTKVYTVEFFSLQDTTIGIETQRPVDAFRVYPVPATDVLNIVTEDYNISTYEIVTLQGQVVLSGNMNNRKAVVNVSSLSKGTYLVKLSRSNGQNRSQLIILE